MKVPKRHPLNLGRQALVLRQVFPESDISLRVNQLAWTGWLRPTTLSRRFRVYIELGHDGVPRVRVVEPRLETREAATPPHTYHDGTLCLYSRGEWNAEMSLALTIVPWTSEWLLNYEIWFATGEWHGGGEWPPRRNKPLKSAA